MDEGEKASSLFMGAVGSKGSVVCDVGCFMVWLEFRFLYCYDIYFV